MLYMTQPMKGVHIWLCITWLVRLLPVFGSYTPRVAVGIYLQGNSLRRPGVMIGYLERLYKTPFCRPGHLYSVAFRNQHGC